MSDLVHGKYPLGHPLTKALGGQVNASQANLAVRSNLEWFGINDLTDAAASLVTGKATVVAVPVEVGDVISKVSILAGATAESGGSHAWAAIYSGVPTTAVLLGAQSVDATGATLIAASARADFTLATPVEITAAVAPGGFVYAVVSVTGTVPSLISAAVAVAAQYPWFTGSPAVFGGTEGSGLGATAPATITLSGVTAIATPPVVFLS